MNKSWGMTIGLFLAGMHLLWAILVALGFAQVLLDFIFSLHFLTNPFVVGEFDIVRAVGLILMTFVFGYFYGLVLSWLWDKIHK